MSLTLSKSLWYPLRIHPQLAPFGIHFNKAASVYTCGGVRASSDMDRWNLFVVPLGFPEFLCQLPKISQPQGPPCLINRALIYPSDWILPQQGYTSPLKKADRRSRESGCLRRESDSKLPKAGDCRGVYACRVKRCWRKVEITFCCLDTIVWAIFCSTVTNPQPCLSR